MFEKEESIESRVHLLYGDVPRQDDRQVQQDPGKPDGTAHRCPLSAEPYEEKNDEEGEKERDWTFRQRGDRAKEVQIEEPELCASLIPRVPHQQPDVEKAGKRHFR